MEDFVLTFPQESKEQDPTLQKAALQGRQAGQQTMQWFVPRMGERIKGRRWASNPAHVSSLR